MSNKLIIVSAPSGAGKTTLVKHLLDEVSNLEFSISCTTRAPRPNEINGKDYYFIGLEEFENNIKQGLFVEYEEVYEGCFYGTLKSEINRIWEANGTVIFDIDVQGGINIKKQFPKQALSIFIQPPSVQVLEERLRHRNTEDESFLRQRVNKAVKELEFANQFDLTIENDDLELAKKEIVSKVNTFIIN